MPPSDQRRPQPPAAVPAEPATQQRAMAALLVALLSLTGVLALANPERGVYLVAYALLAGLVAMWLALTSLARARRGRTARPHGSAAAAALAGVGILVSMVLLLAFAVLGRQMSAYGRCLSEAGTPTAQQACQAQFTHALNQEISSLRAAEGS
jgi:hypothetical protein